MKNPFESDGCSWFPDLWIRKCCEEHDFLYWMGVPRIKADIDFMGCIVMESAFLGAFAFLFAGAILTGMMLGQPVRDFLKKKKK